ncbi:MAG: 2Fe-2S iron-sulfur cluster binding domain-containing protein [Candidatus Latescibacteria bacterium]|nr:2Fe-2S iron-sulfur cluster binding domain-containing protein [Candidatus Latescibacterota bacterium]
MAEEHDPPAGISRRGFLKGVGGGLLSGAALNEGLIGAQVAAAAGPEPIKGFQNIQLKVNGAARQVSVEPRTTLLSALRDQLNLTGSKEVCDRGQCGACTVLMDGEAVLACMILALDARGHEITTVEGLAQGEQLSPVQQAFVARDALMCGFCTPGLVVASTALLRKTPNPTAEEIRRGVSGNLCRCGTYPKVFAAIQDAARKMKRGG